MSPEAIHINGRPARRTALLEPAWVLSFILALVAFLVDFTTPHGVADGFLYVLPVLVCFWMPTVEAALYVAMALMIPLALGVVVSPAGAPIWIEATNRLLGAATIWLTALLISHGARLTAQRQHLLARIRELNQTTERLKYGTETSMSRWLGTGLAPNLSAVGTELDRLADQGSSERRTRVIASEAREIIDTAIVAIHDEVDSLRVAVEPVELEWVVKQHVAEFSRQTGIQVRVSGAAHFSVAQGIRADVCSDIVREALTNIAKHACASRVTVEFGEDSDGAHMTIEDDGNGIAPGTQSKSEGLGLLRLEERLRAIGGTLGLSSVIPHGVRVEAWVPPAHRAS